MNYPFVLLIPAMMLADYYLTLVGQRLYQRSYSRHIKLPSYELNPLWQQDVQRVNWVNKRFLALVLVVTLIVTAISQLSDPALAEWLDFPFGALLTAYGLILGRHLSNIFIFSYAHKHPEALSGQVVISQEMALKTSQYQLGLVFLPMLVVTLAAPTRFTIGGLVGVIAVGLAHISWLQQQRQAMNSRKLFVVLLALMALIVILIVILLISPAWLSG